MTLVRIIASPRFYELFDIPPGDEVLYTSALEQILPEYREMVSDAVTASFTNGAHFNVNTPYWASGTVNNAGYARWVNLLLMKKSGSYITGVMADITEQKMDDIPQEGFHRDG